MLWVPRTFFFVVLGFFLFRFFDIIKPPLSSFRKSERGYESFWMTLLQESMGILLFKLFLLHLLPGRACPLKGSAASGRGIPA